MCEVEEIYNKLAVAAALDKVKKNEISGYTQNLFNECKIAYPTEMEKVSLEEFACSISN